MGMLTDRVAIVTGAGRGLGRAHALALASEGAHVVVNDIGVSDDGQHTDAGATVADSVVAEIVEAGGSAIADHSDVSDWEGARILVDTAVTSFGDLDVVVNNAGFLRDRAIVTMSEDDWDSVIKVHLKGHFAVTHWAALHWRSAHKDGIERHRSLINTASTSGLFANPGQSNYGAAKSGIATFSQIAAQELARYGVISNCIVPGARTRLTLGSPGLSDIMEPTPGHFDQWDPANASPLVVLLSRSGCRISGETFSIMGGMVQRMHPWATGEIVDSSAGWTVESLEEALESMISGE